MNTKNFVLMRDIVIRYHPEISKSKDLISYGLKYPEIFNIERLIEESIAHVGGRKFVDEDGYDFLPCFSDSKTASVGGDRKFIRITSVENKIGSLRVTAFNPFKDCVDFFYIPKDEVESLSEFCAGKNPFKKRIRKTWNEKKDFYNGLEDFRLSNFELMSLA